MSEVELLIDRVKLYDLWQQHPAWKPTQLCVSIGRSLSWVRDWLHRYQAVETPTLEMFQSRSRARITSNKQVDPEVETAILRLRDELPAEYHRVVGPETILYHLHKENDLREAGYYLPTSTSTIWSILDKNGCIGRYSPRERHPEELAEPMTVWQMDFKSISSVPPVENGKQQHVVETLNIVDKGTSILVDAVPREDYHAQTVFTTMLDVFRKEGVPRTLQFDRDPRFVGAWSAREFPSAWMRFLYALGLQPLVCPARQPQKNAYVERYNGSYERECLVAACPQDLSQTIVCTGRYKRRYNHERPHQGRACQNQPPRLVFPDVRPDRVLPELVDPVPWLLPTSRRLYQRRTNTNGSLQIGGFQYYIGKRWAKRILAVRVLPQEKVLAVYDGVELVKKVPIKGLYNGTMELADYVECIMKEALAESRRLAVKRRQRQRQPG
jgi:transposase InsO family protein